MQAPCRAVVPKLLVEARRRQERVASAEVGAAGRGGGERVRRHRLEPNLNAAAGLSSPLHRARRSKHRCHQRRPASPEVHLRHPLSTATPSRPDLRLCPNRSHPRPR
jgi:hypothetical protein